MVLSREPDTIWRLSAEKATDSTSLEWPRKRRVVAPAGMEGARTSNRWAAAGQRQQDHQLLQQRQQQRWQQWQRQSARRRTGGDVPQSQGAASGPVHKLTTDWIDNTAHSAPVVMSHRRRVPSQEPVRQNWPSEEITTSCAGA